MNRITFAGLSLAMIGVCLFGNGQVSAQNDDKDKALQKVYAPMSAADAQSKTLAWVASQGEDAKKNFEQVGSLWSSLGEDPRADDVLRVVIETFRVCDPGTAELIAKCSAENPPLFAPEISDEISAAQDKFFVNNLRLFLGKYLAQQRFYDDAVIVFEETTPESLVDPASFFFYKAVAEHELRMKQEGLKTITLLLDNTESVPVRYESVAKLMKYDLESLKEKSLDEVARMMSDVERRLDLGRSGQKVQKIEGEIIARLDAIIEKIEQQNGDGPGGPGGNSNKPNGSPANDSSVKGSTAPGDVDSKNVGKEDGWGGLPPKDQAKAKQIIGNLFPPNYQKAIEAYSKKAARRKTPTRP